MVTNWEQNLQLSEGEGAHWVPGLGDSEFYAEERHQGLLLSLLDSAHDEPFSRYLTPEKRDGNIYIVDVKENFFKMLPPGDPATRHQSEAQLSLTHALRTS